MAITYKKNSAVFSEVADGEEAEALLEWLHQHPKAKIDLKACTHLHPANLQVLMAARCSVHKPPADDELRKWIGSALKPA